MDEKEVLDSLLKRANTIVFKNEKTMTDPYYKRIKKMRAIKTFSTFAV